MTGRLVSRTWHHDPTLNAPPRYRRACRYDAFIPTPLAKHEITFKAGTAGFISDAEAAIRELNGAAKPEMTPLGRFLLKTESIASTRIEGVHLDMGQLARAEARDDAGREVGREAEEILANIDAMQLAVEDAAAVDRFSVAEILAIHRRLMERAPNGHIAGRTRTVQNWIGGNEWNPCGADYVPPPPEEVDALLNDLCDAVNDVTLQPLVQAALVHAQFETIHPFDDGNGRTGRSLIHVILRRRGIAPEYVPPISVALATSRDRYIAGLIDFREGRYVAWLEHFAGAAARAARLASEYLVAVRDLTEGWRDALRESANAPRADAAAWALINVLPAHPVINAAIAAEATKRSKPQIHEAIKALQAVGVLEAISKGKRNRSYEATGLLDLLTGLEAGGSL